MLRRCAVVVSLLLSLPIVWASATDFKKLGPVLDSFRRGGPNELVVRRDEKAVQALKGVDTSITAAEGKALFATATALPSLKFSTDGVWVEAQVNRNTAVLRPITAKGEEDQSRHWKTHSLEQVIRFPVEDWPKFVGFAIEHGLSGLKEFQYNGSSEVELLFAPMTPDAVRAGARSLVLNHDFAAVMRISSKYPPRSGPNGFVILLHDPHWDINGRFETLAGLRALISANSTAAFRFLVEGAYNDPGRAVPMAGLDSAIRQGAAGDAAVVSKLLRSYLINTPMAYRLLYDRSIDTRAIDNNDLLKYDAPRPQRQLREQLQSLDSILTAVTAAPIDESIKRKLQEIFVMTSIFVTADIRDVSDTMLVEHYTSIAQMYRQIASLGRELRKAGMNLSESALTAIDQDALGWSDEAEQYDKARKRNDTMIPYIVAAARDTARVPIAFIGSYHTEGIVAGLQRQSIGYIVVEARPRRSTTEAEQRAFDQANHFNTREAYLTNAGLNMGMNAPSQREVEAFFAPRIKRALPEFESQLGTARREFSALNDSALQVEKLIATTKLNSSLAPARLSAGGGGADVPPKLRSAFAFFDPGDSKGGRFVVTDVKDPRWSDNDRYDFLRLMPFLAPETSSGVKVARNVAFYPDPVSHRLFMTVYEPRSGRIYCLEGDPQKAASFVPLPSGGLRRGMDIRAQVAELIMRILADDNG